MKLNNLCVSYSFLASFLNVLDWGDNFTPPHVQCTLKRPCQIGLMGGRIMERIHTPLRTFFISDFVLQDTKDIF